MDKKGHTDNSSSRTIDLEGQLLIAMPSMPDPRFSQSVIYLCAHSSEGAMGFIINRPAENIDFPSLLDQVGINDNDPPIKLSDDLLGFSVHFGGPVETGRGFVLHSSEYNAKDGTLEIDDQVSLTATLDILRAIAEGEGPKQALLALGYAGWGPGQLEAELLENGWLTVPADKDLIFLENNNLKYEKALLALGISPAQLVADAGHA